MNNIPGKVRNFDCGLFFYRLNPKCFLVTVFLVLSQAVCTVLLSQTVNLGDSLRYFLKAKPGLVLKSDGRSSFVTGAPARIYGIKAGLSFSDRVSFGIGYNWLGKGIRREVADAENRLTMADLRYHSFAPYFEYVFYRKNQIAVSVPAQIGFGFSSLRYRNEEGASISVKRGFMVVYEPAMTIEHAFLKYFALGGGVGYRLVLLGNRAIDDRFTSPIYLIRFKVDFKALYRDLSEGSRD